MIKSNFIEISSRKAYFSLFLLISIFFFSPVSASAGLVSFVGDILSGGENKITLAKDLSFFNSQNMALLKAQISAGSSQGGGDISIVDNSALISETGPTGTIADVVENKSSDHIATYIVRDGDTLGQVAQMFGVSVGTIIWSNDIQQGDLIKKGQILSILPINGVKHTVKKGETLASIVKKYQGDLKETRQYNDLLEDDTLAVGDTVIIPGGIDIIPTKVDNSITAAIARNQVNVRGTSGPSYSGYYIRPISGGKISQNLHGYNAIDFAAPLNTPILASASGEVIISKDNGYWNGGYGNYIVIKHDNGTQTLYAHLNSNIVSVGYHVVQGQVIGYMGSTGRSTGSHVHFEVRGAKNPF
ncbi:MAG: peptidoglycan DD-metalloendopeptidase family protein [Patescibacteria group bacterium]